MFTFIENSHGPVNLDYQGNIFEKLLRRLVTSFSVCRCKPPQSTHAEFDKVHYVAILEVFWCGCLSQMKENRRAYNLGTTDIFRRMLIDAFDAGRKHGPIKEEPSEGERMLNSK
jgi:hypothetical protein